MEESDFAIDYTKYGRCAVGTKMVSQLSFISNVHHTETNPLKSKQEVIFWVFMMLFHWKNYHLQWTILANTWVLIYTAPTDANQQMCVGSGRYYSRLHPLALVGPCFHRLNMWNVWKVKYCNLVIVVVGWHPSVLSCLLECHMWGWWSWRTYPMAPAPAQCPSIRAQCECRWSTTLMWSWSGRASWNYQAAPHSCIGCSEGGACSRWNLDSSGESERKIHRSRNCHESVWSPAALVQSFDSHPFDQNGRSLPFVPHWTESM